MTWMCKHGHDKEKVGVSKSGRCKKCKVEGNRRQRYEDAKKKPKSLIHAQQIPQLRQARKDLGISVPELAHLTGLHESTIYYYEQGRRARPYALQKIMGAIASRMREKKWEHIG